MLWTPQEDGTVGLGASRYSAFAFLVAYFGA